MSASLRLQSAAFFARLLASRRPSVGSGAGLVPGTDTVRRATTERSNQGALGAGTGAGSRPLFFFAARSTYRTGQHDRRRKHALGTRAREGEKREAKRSGSGG
uniref:Uncharacterized protein n=1 Tax=Plectus sambesii TaxID=2011161 RepID=A0A914WGA1_9BILA